MKRTALAALLAAVLALPASAGEFEAWSPAIARHELKSLDGTTARVADLEGDIVVVNFWASWCKPCRRELVELQEWTEEMTGDDVRIVAVSIDQDRKNAERFLRKTGLTLPVYHDGTEGLARELDLPSLPCTVVIGRDGRIVRVEQGGRDVVREVQAEVRELLQTPRAGASEEVSG